MMSKNGSLGQQRAFGLCSDGPCLVIPIVGGLYMLLLGLQPEAHRLVLTVGHPATISEKRKKSFIQCLHCLKTLYL